MNNPDCQAMLFGSESHPKRVLFIEGDMPDILVKVTGHRGIDRRECHNEGAGRFPPAKSREGGPFPVGVAAEDKAPKVKKFWIGHSQDERLIRRLIVQGVQDI
jgi:hypothetical protein